MEATTNPSVQEAPGQSFASPSSSLREAAENAMRRLQLLGRQELALAKLEMKMAGERAGKGIALLVVAGALSILALASVVHAIVLAIGEDWPPWGIFLGTTIGLLLVAILLAVPGILLLKKAKERPVEDFKQEYAETLTLVKGE